MPHFASGAVRGRVYRLAGLNIHPSAVVMGNVELISPRPGFYDKLTVSAGAVIGDHRTLTRYPFSGRLYLGVNDDYLNDNAGQYTASVNVEPYRR